MDELIVKCINGDRKAQYILYQQYAKAMFNTCYRVVNSTEEAEDVLQEAFVSAFRNLKTFKGNSTFGAWLKRIVINHAINAIRKKKLEVIAFEENYEGKAVEDGPDIDDQALNVTKIKKAMEQLPEGYRIVFSLYLIEGYDHNEISEILNISVSTSKSQLNRAKAKLKYLLTQMD